MPVPERGFPVVIANHGYVPEPRKYGITADGRDSRPGDYYRSVPELYTSRGFLVVIPDYRGHNRSEGYDQIKGRNYESVDLYAEDVLALVEQLRQIQDADIQNVFIWSHSMGGAVAMRVLLATDAIKAASFWSTMSVDNLSGQFNQLGVPIVIQHAVGDKSTEFSNSERLALALNALGHPHEFHSYDTNDHFFEGEIRQRAADLDADFFLSL